MKTIKVLGTGCANCKTTLKLIEDAVAELGADVQLEKVEDIGDIMAYGVISTPGVVIGSGDDVLRLQKRLRCAARALDANVHFQIQRSNIEAAQRGAQRGPLVVAGDTVLADGLLPVEELQRRLAERLMKQEETEHAGI